MFLIINAAVGGDGGTNPYKTATLPQTLLVDYVHITTSSTPIYQVTPSAGANGSISPSSVVTVNPGNTTTFSVTPNAGYSASVGGTCGGSLSGNTYTTNAITAPCTVTASFGSAQDVPPTNVTATAGNAQATVSFRSPLQAPITGYTATSSPGGITASGCRQPHNGDGADQRHCLYIHGNG